MLGGLRIRAGEFIAFSLVYARMSHLAYNIKEIACAGGGAI